jgi:hypothetical protein
LIFWSGREVFEHLALKEVVIKERLPFELWQIRLLGV